MLNMVKYFHTLKMFALQNYDYWRCKTVEYQHGRCDTLT